MVLPGRVCDGSSIAEYGKTPTKRTAVPFRQGILLFIHLDIDGCEKRFDLTTIRLTHFNGFDAALSQVIVRSVFAINPVGRDQPLRELRHTDNVDPELVPEHGLSLEDRLIARYEACRTVVSGCRQMQEVRMVPRPETLVTNRSGKTRGASSAVSRVNSVSGGLETVQRRGDFQYRIVFFLISCFPEFCDKLRRDE